LQQGYRKRCKMLTQHVSGFHIALALVCDADIAAGLFSWVEVKAFGELELPHISRDTIAMLNVKGT
jgi:hypothetical protein